jgi:hypothetical protein
LTREPGRRDSRFAHLFSGEVASQAPLPDVERGFAEETSFPDMRQEERLERLESEVRALRDELNDLKARLGG